MQPDPWMSKVRRGDKLRPISLWNKSTGSKGSRLPDEVKVTGVVVSSMSQSGPPLFPGLIEASVWMNS